jgi:hypothetical protein
MVLSVLCCSCCLCCLEFFLAERSKASSIRYLTDSHSSLISFPVTVKSILNAESQKQKTTPTSWHDYFLAASLLFSFSAFASFLPPANSSRCPTRAARRFSVPAESCALNFYCTDQPSAPRECVGEAVATRCIFC